MTREERINKRIKEHYEYLEEQGYEIVGLFLQGSQNYNNDIYDDDYCSDIDSKAIVLPTFDDFISGRQPVSNTLVLENNEHIDVKDIRIMFNTLQKSNVNFLEILFTDFKIINPKYQELFQPVIDNNERLATADMKQLLNCCVGMSKQKFCALKHPYPTIKDKIDKFGYDPKQLNHIIRMNYFIKRIITGESFKTSLNEIERKDYLVKVKKGIYSLDEAERLAVEFDTESYEIKEEILKTRNYLVDSDAYKIYDNVKCNILKQWFKELLLSEHLELPTWEEFKKSKKDYKFSHNGKNYILAKDVCADMMASCFYHSDIVILILDETNKEILFDKAMNEENYRQACQKCKRLFLGE